MEYIYLGLFAFIAGFIDSIAGAGGVITLPALLLFGIPPRLALGTNKLQALMGTTCAVVNYIKNKKVKWNIALLGIPFSIVGSFLGAKLTYLFSQDILTLIILILIPISMIFILYSKVLLKKTSKHPSILITIVCCFFIGVYDGFYGPGTGTFLIIVLVVFCNISLLNAGATAKTLNLATNISAFITFSISGSVDYRVGLVMGSFNAFGAILGSSLAIKKGSNYIQKIIFLASFLLFVSLLLKYFKVV